MFFMVFPIPAPPFFFFFFVGSPASQEFLRRTHPITEEGLVNAVVLTVLQC